MPLKYTTVTYDEIKRDELYAFRFLAGDKEFWIPKEWIIKHDKDEKTIEIPEWKAIKEGVL